MHQNTNTNTDGIYLLSTRIIMAYKGLNNRHFVFNIVGFLFSGLWNFDKPHDDDDDKHGFFV